MAITWVIARTVGSLVGPAVTMPAKAGFGQLVSTILEALILADGAVLLARGRWRASVPGSAWAGEPGRASARLAASSRRVRSNSPAVRPAASYGPGRRAGLSWRGCLVRRGPRPAHASAVCFCGQPTRLAVSPPNARHGLGTAPASSVNPRPGRSESWRHTLKLTRKWSGRSASASVAGHGRCCCCQPRPALSSPRHGPCAPASPIGLTAAGLFAEREGSRADSRVRSLGAFTGACRPAVTSAFDAVPDAYHNPAAGWWGPL